VQPVVLTHSSESLRSMAIAGIGVTALPEWSIATALADGRLVRLLGDYPMAESGLYAVYPSNRLMTPKVRRFVEHIIPHLPAYVRPS
jgi:DNA-binding transcriptional LysR family regulator